MGKMLDFCVRSSRFKYSLIEFENFCIPYPFLTIDRHKTEYGKTKSPCQAVGSGAEKSASEVLHLANALCQYLQSRGQTGHDYN
jgi:hypothetical protein